MKKLVAALAALLLLAGCSGANADPNASKLPRPESIDSESSRTEVTGEGDPADVASSSNELPTETSEGAAEGVGSDSTGSGSGEGSGTSDGSTSEGSSSGNGSGSDSTGSSEGGSSDSSQGGSQSTTTEGDLSGGNTEETEPDDGFVHLSSGKLTVTSFGRYSGAYVEDGSDEPVTDVAVILVQNESEQYLSFASLTFDIDGKTAQFTLTGLPAGEAAWVLEANRLTVDSGALFTSVDEVSTFDDASLIPGVTVTPNDGSLTVQNRSGKALKEGYVYYKLRHTDGNFLGGITYRTPVGDLGDGETATPMAGHSKADGCVIVRITSNDE